MHVGIVLSNVAAASCKSRPTSDMEKAKQMVVISTCQEKPERFRWQFMC